ncbi:MAG: hypothetical protein AAGG07_10570 [Planctomycetota bacterium]
MNAIKGPSFAVPSLSVALALAGACAGLAHARQLEDVSITHRGTTGAFTTSPLGLATPLGVIVESRLTFLGPVALGEDGSVAFLADIGIDPTPGAPGDPALRIIERRNAAFLSSQDGTVTRLLPGTETDALVVGGLSGPFVTEAALRVDSFGRAWFRQGGLLDGAPVQTVIVAGGQLGAPEIVVDSRENILEAGGELSVTATVGRPTVDGRHPFFSGFNASPPIPDAPIPSFVGFAEPGLGQSIVAQSVEALPLQDGGTIDVFVPGAVNETRDGLLALDGNVGAPGPFGPRSNAVLLREPGEAGWQRILTEGDTLDGLDGGDETLLFIAAGVSGFTLGGVTNPLPIGNDSVLTVGALVDPLNPFAPGPLAAMLATPGGGRVLAKQNAVLPGTGIVPSYPPTELDLSECGRWVLYVGDEESTGDRFVAIADLTAPTVQYQLIARDDDLFAPSPTGQTISIRDAGISDDGRPHYEVSLPITAPGAVEPLGALVAVDGFGNARVFFDVEIVNGAGSIRLATNRCGQVVVAEDEGAESFAVLSMPHPDRDCDGLVNGSDVQQFLAEFDGGGATTDADADEMLTFFDVLTMLQVADAASP